MRLFTLFSGLLLLSLPSLLLAEKPKCAESIVGCFQTSEQSALSVYEPMYLIAGGEYGEDLKGRFQFSFKYKLFDDQSSLIKSAPWLDSFHLAYTQTSLWNWSKESLPFEDTSYKPSFYFTLDASPAYDLLAFGYAHESNGQAEEISRSMDAMFIQPVWSFPLANSSLILYPRFLYYFRKGEFNEDLADYRGYVDLKLRYGNQDSWGINTLYRYGKSGQYSVQVDLTYPIRTPISIRTGGFLYLQYFQGYGESMLSYNKAVGPIFRIGLGIVR
ncbi:phospholipase A [Marinospirillum minutulum]|uniref:phospholipase A n=1 Tax=Marinospirillum minutulum TaxID=64974 RepID=UPI000688AAFC|nr:phospholipase A [Marinospirillum minutulum]